MTATAMTKDCLNNNEATKLLSVSRQTIHRWRVEDGFPEPIDLGFEKGGPLLFPIDEVLKWAKQNDVTHDEKYLTQLRKKRK